MSRKMVKNLFSYYNINIIAFKWEFSKWFHLSISRIVLDTG